MGILWKLEYFFKLKNTIAISSLRLSSSVRLGLLRQRAVFGNEILGIPPSSIMFTF